MNKPLGRVIGLDVHRDSIYVTVLDLAEGKTYQYEISTKDKDLKAFLETLRPDDRVALEATCGARRYVKLLRSRVAEVAVANPKKLQTFTVNSAKNDRNDSLLLALHMSVGSLATLFIPDDETQHDAELLGCRNDMRRETTRIKNQIRALLTEHGLRYKGSDLASKDARLFLLKVKVGLPESAREVLTCQLKRLEELERHIQRLDDRIEVRGAHRPEVGLLMTIRGLNTLLALTILVAIGCIKRFPTPGSLRNYAGLVPRQRASANHNHQGRLTRPGSKELRWALTEAVHVLIKVEGPYQDFYNRLRRKKKAHGKAIAACAGKLVEAIWHMLTRGETFRLAEPDLIERKTRRRAARLAHARNRLAEEKPDRQEAAFADQLALLSDLARRGAKIPLPPPVQASFNRFKHAS